jgi:hypothetical protein
VRSISQVPNAATILLLSLWIPNYSFAGRAEQQVVTSAHTISLGIEDCSGDSLPRRRRARSRIAERYQPGRFIPTSRRDSWIRIGRRKGG